VTRSDSIYTTLFFSNAMVVIANKVALVTGASRGIGKEFCKQLKAKNNVVIAGCRDPSDMQDGLADDVFKLDVSDQASIDHFAAEVAAKYPHLDLVINNAGVYGARVGFGDMDAETMLHVFNTNAVGPLMITQALYAKNIIGGKSGTTLAHITSKMGSVDDNGSGSSYAYRASKSALNIISKSLSIDLAPDNINSTLLHPGWVITDMVNNRGLITTTQSVTGMLHVLESKSESELRGAWHAFDGKVIPW
jgi:NAD(P)-dependent dehydrogenase (short-subunit alcohol dehydrogenase family)